MRPRFAAFPLAGLALAASLGAAPPTGDLSSLAFLSGAWSGAAGEVAAGEMWTTPAGGRITIHRDASAGAPSGSVPAHRGGLRRRHWASRRENRRRPSPGRERAKPRRVREPRPRLPAPGPVLAREDGSLRAKIEGTLGGKPASQQWSWRRTP
jgi:hypothetical protein